MHHSPSSNQLSLPREIVISDEHGLVERIPTGPQAQEREMAFWMIKEMSNQNKELQEQLAAQKKKWYVITAGIATTVIPLVICGVELWNITHECEQ
jgi:hypothetical protein